MSDEELLQALIDERDKRAVQFAIDRINGMMYSWIYIIMHRNAMTQYEASITMLKERLSTKEVRHSETESSS